jgi:hypothetical protein
MRLLQLLSGLIIAVGAVLLHLSASDRSPGNLLYIQAGFAPLARAEAALRSGEVQRARALFQHAALRAAREGRREEFSRILNRLGWEGRELLSSSPEAAWPFLSIYALWADDFPSASLGVETWVLDHRPEGGSFEYSLTDSTGGSVWKERITRAPLWLLRNLPRGRELPQLQGGLYGHTVSELPRGGMVAHIQPLRLRFGLGRGWGSIRLETSRSGPVRWYLSVNNLIRWNEPRQSPGGTWSLSSESDWGVDRLVEAGGIRRPESRLVLIRKYERL